MSNSQEPVFMTDFFKRIKKDLGPKVALGAAKFYIACEGVLATFDDLRKETLANGNPKGLKAHARAFAEKLSSGEFDTYLSKGAYDTLHSQKPIEQPRLPAPASPLENELTIPTPPAEDSPKPGYSPPNKNLSLLGLSENLRGSESAKDKRTGDLLAKLSAKFSVANLTDITAKKIGVDDLKDAGFDELERHLLKDYLDDIGADIRPTLRVHPNNLTHRITDTIARTDVERFISRRDITTIEELASKSYTGLLQQGLSAKGAMTLSSILETHYRTELGSIKFDEKNRPTRLPSSPPSTQQLPQQVSISKPVFSPALPQPTPQPQPQPRLDLEPEADNPLVANPNYDKLPVKKPEPIENKLPDAERNMKSSQAGDITRYLEPNNKRLVQSHVSQRGINTVFDLYNQFRKGNTGDLPKKTVASVLEAINDNYISIKRTESKSEPQRERGYTVELGSDGRSILVDGRVAITATYSSLVQRQAYLHGIKELLTFYSAGDSIAEVAKKTGKGLSAIRQTLERAGIKYSESQAPPLAFGGELKRILDETPGAPPQSIFEDRP